MIHLPKDKHVVGSCKHGNSVSGLSNYVYWMYYQLHRPNSPAINSSPWREVTACSTPWSVPNLPTTDHMCDFSSVARVRNNGAVR